MAAMTLHADSRGLTAVAAALCGVLLITLLYFTLPEHLGHTLLDSGQTFPFSVQNGMWIAFCVGLGELFQRYRAVRREERQVRVDYLPTDPTVVILLNDLGDIYANLQSSADLRSTFLPRLIDRCILQLQASRKTEQSALLLNTSMEMFIHEVDLRYNMLRYICWVIPSLGFIGTVVGIGRALSIAGNGAGGENENLLGEITAKLAVSFDGTFVALVLASILVLLQNIIQSREEHALNQAGQYCLDNLINRLFIPE